MKWDYLTGSFRSSEAAVHTRVSLMNSLMFIIELVILGSRIETREAPQAARYQTQMIFHKVMFQLELRSRKPNSKQETKQKHTGEKKKEKEKLHKWNTGEVFFQASTRQLNCVNPEIAGSAHQTSSSARHTQPKLNTGSLKTTHWAWKCFEYARLLTAEKKPKNPNQSSTACESLNVLEKNIYISIEAHCLSFLTSQGQSHRIAF